MVHRNAHGLEMNVAIGSGNPPTQIVEQAQRLGADLVVIGTHGRSGFKRMLLGSVAERVLRLSPLPVLTVSKPATAQQESRGNR